MEREFIPYEQALALKELGFDEECLMYWNDYGKQAISRFQLLNRIDSWSINYIEAPTFSQAFRWFREKYNLFYGISVFNAKFVKESGLCHPFMAAICNKSESLFYEGYEIYEEAELECLKKLIEIVKK